MKINKVLLLTLLVALLAIVVRSQSPHSSTISIEEKKDCAISDYTDTENVYGYISRERDAYGNCPYYYDYTHCLNLTGPNTVCTVQRGSFNTTCKTGLEQYQSYEVVGKVQVTKNVTKCIPKSFIVSIALGRKIEKREIDFSSWGVCVQGNEGDCLTITCGNLQGGSARNGVFNGCDGGKSCQKFMFCQDGKKVLFKATRGEFLEEDPTFHLNKITSKDVGE